MGCRVWEVGEWGSGGMGKWESGEIELKPQNPFGGSAERSTELTPKSHRRSLSSRPKPKTPTPKTYLLSPAS